MLIAIAPVPCICYLPPMVARSSKRKEENRYGQSGYPAVEKLIDTEDFTELNSALEVAYGELLDISKRKKGLKTQRDAKKAMRALELTMELLRELLAIKYRIQEDAAQQAK